MKIGELFTIKKGKKNENAQSFYEKGFIRYIQIEDLRSDDKMKYCKPDALSVISKKDDIIITWDGANAGTCHYGLEGVIGSTLSILSTQRKDIYIPYIGKFLKSKSRYLREQCTGATIPHIQKDTLCNLQIPLPTLDIQKKIVAVLDKADQLRQKRKQVIKKLDELLHSVFLDMFGDPVTNPKGWENYTLDELSSKIVDCPHSTPIHLNSITSYPCIRTSELSNGYIDWSSMKYLDEQGYIERAKRLKPIAGDIVYGREGTFGEAIRIPTAINMCLGQRTMLFRPNYKKCTSEFLWSIIRSNSVYKQAVKMTNGSTVGHINVGDAKQFIAYLPPIESQRKYSKIVSEHDSLREKQAKSLDYLDNLFNSILQRAFKGELEFNDKVFNGLEDTINE